MHIGIYGGSFNPPHIAHLLAVTYSLSAHNLNKVLIIPCFQHAFAKDAHLAAYEHRLAMCERAFDLLGERVGVSTIEQELGGVSRTLHTLTSIKEQHPDWSLRLIVGTDIIAERNKWYRFNEVMACAPLLVIGRRGYPADKEYNASPALMSLSSRDIRARIRRGEAIDGLVSPPVDQYIKENALYR